MRRAIAAVVTGLATAACSVVGVRSGTEEPAYTVSAHVGEVEIRVYGPRVAAETTLDDDEMAARSAGFGRLASYIFGGNRSGSRIDMTAPVAQAAETIDMTAPVAQSRDAAGRWVIRFFMPAQFTLVQLPIPNDVRVRLVEVPGETLGVLRFTGSTSREAVALRRQQLLTALCASAWQPQGTPVAWFYDPPWTLPFLRRNEVAVVVSGS